MLSKKKLRIFRNFSPKGGGGLANSEISLSEKTGASELLRGGGSQNFGVFMKKKKCFFFMSPLIAEDHFLVHGSIFVIVPWDQAINSSL